MCLAIPAKVTEINGNTATVETEGMVTTANLSVLPDVKIGDYVMVHAGLAIQKYDEKEALENLTLIRQLYATLNDDNK